MNTALTWLAVAVAGLSVLGCADHLPQPVYSNDSNTVDAFAILVESSPYGVAADEDMLALPEDVDDLLARTLGRVSTANQKIDRLAALFATDGALGLRYETMATGTARETLATRVGSCLSYTNLYIALARRVGVDARFREVISVLQWDLVGDYVVLNRHVVAYGEIRSVGTYNMDFGLIERGEGQYGRVISDDRARAQHFNNRGAWALAQNDAEAAVRFFNRSLIIDRRLNYVWANLGTAYMRLYQPDRAELALRHALWLRPYESTPLNQLARLYQLEGKPELADVYLERAGNARFRNPYALFQRGLEARREGDLKSAIAFLRRAIKRQPGELHFLIELGQTYRIAGEFARARATFLDANELVTTLEERKALLDALNLQAPDGVDEVDPQQEGPRSGAGSS